MAPVTTPRYRYREEAPEVIAVPASELFDRLPQELRGEQGGGALEGRLINLPCAEILRGNVPRITLGRLGELASGLVRMPEGLDPSELINLPPGWIALHFRMVTRREELPPEPGTENATPVIAPVLVEPIISKADASLVEAEPVSPAPPPPWEATAEKNDGAAMDLEPSKADPDVLPKKGFFSSLPMFRRSEDSGKSSAPAPATTQEIPLSTESPEIKELVPASLVLERLWKLDPQDELADGSALQSLFMTDEKLTLEKVVSKAGELPGLDACVLAHGDRVICASKAPAGTDLQTLSGQAMAMLSQIRDSSEKMGLGAVPAVTLHADRGVISFLHRGELCLLVIHSDRGFVPGVRERLQEMLGHLSEARPALPAAPAP